MEKKQNMIMPFKQQLQGMTKLDRSKFLKIVKIPYVKVPCKSVGRVLGLKSVNKYFLKKEDGLKHTMESSVPGEKLLLFNHEALSSQEDEEKAGISNEDVRRKILEDLRSMLGEQAPTDFFHMERSIGYEQWQAKSCIKAILPPPLEFSSFSQVGHIAHLNLREEMLPYKFIIGEIIHDKISWAKTVVNKLDMISSEFRFFDMELLAGEPNYVTEMTEKGVRYRMDFSKVFWNSRLSDVHESIVKQFNHRSVVFDVFCGIGPFVLPAIKNQKIKKAFANDLNPISVQYLNENIVLNKISKDRINVYTMDGANFIRNVIPEEFSRFYDKADFDEAVTGPNFHIVMNLPSLSVSFLPYFKGFLSKHPQSKPLFKSSPIYIHCHFFITALRDNESKEWFAAEAVRLVKEAMQLRELEIQDVRYLRQVSGKKWMFCVSLQLPEKYAYLEEEPEKETSINKNIDEQSENEETKSCKRKLIPSVAPNEEVVEKMNKIS